jgi:hypothetical protein
MRAPGALRTAILDANGVEQQRPPIVEAPGRDVMPTAAAWNGSALLVSYSIGRVGYGTMYAKFVDRSGALIDPSAQQRRELLEPAAPGRVIAFAPEGQMRPAIAPAHDHEALAVWSERTEGSAEFLARAVVLRDGAAAGDPIVIGSSGTSASVAFGASTYLVVTTRGGSPYRIEARRIARDGTPIDAAPFAILSPDTSQNATVTFDGENFVIATIVYPTLTDRGRVVAVRVRPDGTVLDPEGIVIDAPNGVQRLFNAPVIASSGDGTIVLWRYGTDLLAAVLSRAGVPSKTTVAHLVDVPPGVTWTGTTYVVAWMDIFGHGLRWTPLDASGNVTGTPGFLPLAVNTIDPTVAARLGDGALIAWLDFAGTNRDIHALRVASDGSAHGVPFTLAATEFAESSLTMAGGASSARIIYERPIDFPGVSLLPRVFTRTIEEVAPARRRVIR